MPTPAVISYEYFIAPPAEADTWIESMGLRRNRRGKFIWIEGYAPLADGHFKIFYREGWSCPDVEREAS